MVDIRMDQGQRPLSLAERIARAARAAAADIDKAACATAARHVIDRLMSMLALLDAELDVVATTRQHYERTLVQHMET